MSTALSPRVNISALTIQLTAVSRRMGVEFMPSAMTKGGLVYKPFDPENPRAQSPLDVLIQTRENIPRDRFVDRLPFDAKQNPQHSLAKDWIAMQSIVDGAAGEARQLAEIVRGG